MKRVVVQCATMVAFVVAATLSGMPAAQARDNVAVTQVALPAAATTRVFKGVLRGDARAEYVFQLPAGSRILVDLKTTNASNYVNLVQDGKEEALFAGAMGGNSADIVLREAGTYRVVVYLMRNAARRNEQARYTVRLRTMPLPGNPT